MPVVEEDLEEIIEEPPQQRARAASSRARIWDIKGTPFQQDALTHLDTLYNFAMYLTRNPPEADNLVQETYLRAFRFSHRFQQETHLRAWLFTIARNTFLTFYRIREREAATAENGVPDWDVPMFHDAPEEDARALDVHTDLERAMRTLPEEFRTTFLLAEVEGMQLVEVARVMACPEGTVKSRIFRAKERLSEILQDYGSRKIKKDFTQEQRNEIIAAHTPADGYANRVTGMLPYHPSPFAVLKIWKDANLPIRPPRPPENKKHHQGGTNQRDAFIQDYDPPIKRVNGNKKAIYRRPAGRYRHNELVPRISETPFPKVDIPRAENIELVLPDEKEVKRIVDEYNKLGYNTKLPDKKYDYTKIKAKTLTNGKRSIGNGHPLTLEDVAKQDTDNRRENGLKPHTYRKYGDNPFAYFEEHFKSYEGISPYKFRCVHYGLYKTLKKAGKWREADARLRASKNIKSGNDVHRHIGDSVNEANHLLSDGRHSGKDRKEEQCIYSQICPLLNLSASFSLMLKGLDYYKHSPDAFQGLSRVGF